MRNSERKMLNLWNDDGLKEIETYFGTIVRKSDCYWL